MMMNKMMKMRCDTRRLSLDKSNTNGLFLEPSLLLGPLLPAQMPLMSGKTMDRRRETIVTRKKRKKIQKNNSSER